MKPYSLLAAAAILFAGCSKSNPNNTPFYGDDYGEFDYKIEGTKDTAMEQSGELLAVLKLTKTSGPAEEVKLEITGMPAGVTATFEPPSSKPPFNSLLKIVSNRATPGTYPLIITGQSKSTGLTAHNLNLNIKPYSNAANAVEGICTTSGSCTPQTGALNHEAKVEVVTTQPNRVNIHGFWSDSWNNVIYADLNPVSKTVTVPEQTSVGLTFSGSGTYSDGVMQINYTVKGPLVDEACNITFTRK